MTFHAGDDQSLIRDLLDAKPQAWQRLVLRVESTIWTACRLLAGGEVESQTAFMEVTEALRADGYRRLAPYDGSSRIETFVALVTRDVLAGRVLRLFEAGAGTDGWKTFEAFFAADIKRIIMRRLPGGEREEMRRDAYQDICVALIANDFRRIKAYRGVGSFSGFVLHVVDHLLIDSIRRSAPRRHDHETGSVAMVVSLDERDDIPCDGASPEESLLAAEDERLLSLAADVLLEAAKGLSDAERLYIQIVLGSSEAIPAREVARLMRRRVEEIYKLRQRVMVRLRETLEKNPAVKNWRAYV